MDLTSINLDDYNILDISSIEHIKENNNYIDITVQDDHTLYIYDGEKYILQKQCDGSHIRGLYVGFFKKYAPSIIKDGKLMLLQTPIVCMKDGSGKIKKMFFDLNEYREYEKAGYDKKLTPHYYKGLGSWKAADMRGLINQYGLEYFIAVLEYDENTDTIVHHWLDGREADSRKNYLRQHKLDMDKI